MYRRHFGTFTPIAPQMINLITGHSPRRSPEERRKRADRKSPEANRLKSPTVPSYPPPHRFPLPPNPARPTLKTGKPCSIEQGFWFWSPEPCALTSASRPRPETFSRSLRKSSSPHRAARRRTRRPSRHSPPASRFRLPAPDFGLQAPAFPPPRPLLSN